MSSIILKNVTKRFTSKNHGTVTAVDNFNLTINKGECFSFLGPSGCGKTTTLRMIAGFEDLSEGEIWFGDTIVSDKRKNIYKLPEERGLGMVFQAFAVWPHMNVFNNVAFPLKVKRVNKNEIKKRVTEALRQTNMEGLENIFPNNMSGGQLQRIALARSIVTNPGILLLDEPLSNLDPKLREMMRFEIKELQRKYDFTIVFVTHDQEEAMALSDRMLVMDMGVIQQVDTPQNLYDNPSNKFIYRFLGLSNFIDVDISDGRVYPKGSLGNSIDCEIEPGFLHKEGTLASRPNEIDLISQGGFRTTIKKRIFMGTYLEYRLDIGEKEIRVQSAADKGFIEGDSCGVIFNKLKWYPKESIDTEKEREMRKII